MEEDTSGTKIGIFASIGRTADALQVSRITSPHASVSTERDSNLKGERLGGYKPTLSPLGHGRHLSVMNLIMCASVGKSL